MLFKHAQIHRLAAFLVVYAFSAEYVSTLLTHLTVAQVSSLFVICITETKRQK